MIIALTIATLLGAYLWYGFITVAPAFVARSVSRWAKRFPCSAEKPAEVANERREAAAASIGIAPIWPF